MCHVPTIFSFAPNVDRFHLFFAFRLLIENHQVRYAYRSIAEFVRYVTQHNAEETGQIAFFESNKHTDAPPPCAKGTEHNGHAAWAKCTHCDGPVQGEGIQNVKIQNDWPSESSNESHQHDVNSQQV